MVGMQYFFPKRLNGSHPLRGKSKQTAIPKNCDHLSFINLILMKNS